MQWLLALETDNDVITICRLMNNMRRKSIKIVNFSLAASGSGFSVMALVETPANEVDHVFHFMRRTEGVEQVSCYAETGSRELSSDHLRNEAGTRFVLLNAGTNGLRAQLTEALAGARVVLAAEEKLLLELPAREETRHAFEPGASFGGLGATQLACIHTTRAQPVSELVA
jgi:hypothetical protein